MKVRRPIERYGMYTDDGDDAVARIVKAAKDHGLGYDHAILSVTALADQPCFAEATDTDVREAVWNAFQAEVGQA